MTGEIRNPAKLPTDLNPAEREFVRCLADGEYCIVGNGQLPEKEIKSGEGANVVRGEVIRFFAFSGNEKKTILGPEICLLGAWVSGNLDLTHASIPYALHFSNCHFAVSVVMQYAECAALYLDGSRLAEGLNADGLTTKGSVHLRDDFSAEGEVRLLNANIGGDLNCEGGRFHNPGGNALHADGLTTKGSVHLRDDFSAEGEVRLLYANIGMNLNCMGGKFNNSDGDAFSADGLTTKGDVNLSGDFSADGAVRLLGANIGGNFDCEGGKFHNPGEYALSADGLATKGDVHLNGDFSAEGEVRLLNANISMNLNCMGGKFHNPDGNALCADGLATKGDAHLNGDFSAKGEVRLLGANIGGNFDCEGGKFHNPGEDALSADGLATKGDVHLNGDFSAKGKVRLLGANIGGNLFCGGGKFHNPGGDALSASQLTTKGSVYLQDDFSAEGEVQLLGASIGGDLSCEGGKCHNLGGDALSADGLTTKGSVNLWNGFSAEGEVRLLGASIGGDLSCEGGKFHNPGGNALNVDRGNISGGLFWRETTCTGDVNLAYARADVLTDDSDSWKLCNVDLDGFTYNRFSNPMDAQFRIGWLAKRPDEEEFSSLPYEQAAKVLFGMGHVHDAREILLKKERLLTEHGNFPWMWRQGRKSWNVLAGYGYRPWLHTFLISLGIMAIGSGLFCRGEQTGRIVPHQPAALVSMKYQYGRIPAETPDETVARKFSGYPEFNPILFSVDIFVPFLNLHQEPFWYPAPDGGHQHWWGSTEDGDISWGGWLEGWYWFQIIAGWVLTSLFLLSVTGLLRPRQSSGERD